MRRDSDAPQSLIGRGPPHAHSPPPKERWHEGEIVFLQSTNYWGYLDWHRLIESGYLEEGATCHPVVILKIGNRVDGVLHYAVVPISAFGFRHGNCPIPPWKQYRLWGRDKRDFRSICGSQLSVGPHVTPPLHLLPGHTMPKPMASWIDLQAARIVPETVLTRFDKSYRILKLAPHSLADLLKDLGRRCTMWNNIVNDTKIRAHQKPFRIQLAESAAEGYKFEKESNTGTKLAPKLRCDEHRPQLPTPPTTPPARTSTAIQPKQMLTVPQVRLWTDVVIGA